ncbi:nitrate transporter [Ogataea polymorpha]|uniref:nitrate transporter n=1 Tax=Ogataea polymorpha TaxID=460523 RepID=UPI0007F35AF8|nr:nitrate transporter [Ogataea polymorpha]OBA13463.1 nitrate transporter [Ogataea polymorpha]
MQLSTLWEPPIVNPRNLKATSIPIFNLWNVYGRNFFFGWFGFLFKDLRLTAVDISNNNICGLTGTLLGRFILGPLNDKYGPRITLTGVLVAGAIPTAFVPLVTNVAGLHAIRFFISFLGSSFICCSQFCAVFFDNNIIGTANAISAGWGNAGGGVAFFVMPAISNALENRGYSLHHSWSYSFVIGPFLILMITAILIFVFGSDCPRGRWSLRGDILGINMDNMLVKSVSVTRHFSKEGELTSVFVEPVNAIDKVVVEPNQDQEILEVADIINGDEIIEDPSLNDVVKICLSPRTMLVGLCYMCSFGTELAVESIISNLFGQKMTNWSTSKAGAWGSMLGLLNVVARPAGGIISDFLYQRFKTTKAKKAFFLIWIGLVPELSIAGLIVSVSFLCLWFEMGNGANYACVPVVNRHHSGIVSGVTGAMGNLGGILFSLVFRYTISNGVNNYFKAFWIIGIVCTAVNLVCVLIPIREERPRKAEN